MKVSQRELVDSRTRGYQLISYCGIVDIMYQPNIGQGEGISPMGDDRRVVGD